MGSEKKYDVFLSYSRQDKEPVRRLAEDLRGRGVSVWFDQWVSKPGSRWQYEMESRLFGARYCAVCIGASRPGGWFEAEVHRALDMERGRKLDGVFAVLLPGSDEEHIPAFLRDYTWVDLRREGAHGLSQLVSLFGVPACGRGDAVPAPEVQLNKYVRQTIVQVAYLRSVREEVGETNFEALRKEIAATTLRRIQEDMERHTALVENLVSLGRLRN